MRSILLVIALGTVYSGCASTKDPEAARIPDGGPPDRRAELSNELQSLVLELQTVHALLADGHRSEAGGRAQTVVNRIYYGDSAPLGSDIAELLRQFGIVARAAGYTPAAERAESRVLFHQADPTALFLSLSWEPSASLGSGSQPRSSSAPSEGLRGALEAIGVEVGGGASADPAAPGILALPSSGTPAEASAAATVLVDSNSELREQLRQARLAFEGRDLDAAAAHLEKLLALAKQTSNPPSDVVRDAQVLLAELHLFKGRIEEAELLLRAAIGSMELDGGPVSSAVTHSLARLHALLLAEGRVGEAAALASSDGLGSPNPPADDSTMRSGSGAGDPFDSIGAGIVVDLGLGPIESAWSAGEREDALELADAHLRNALTAEWGAARLRALRILVAEMALDTGYLERARSLVWVVLEGDEFAPRAEGESRLQALTLLERIDSRREERERAEREFLQTPPSIWWSSETGMEPDFWPEITPGPAAAAFDARANAGTGGAPRPRSAAIDLVAASGEALRQQNACSLEEALALRRKIVEAYEDSPNFDAPERLEALRDLAALYRVMGVPDAARVVEARVRD